MESSLDTYSLEEKEHIHRHLKNEFFLFLVVVNGGQNLFPEQKSEIRGRGGRD